MEKIHIHVNDTNLGAILLADDMTKPVLLFLSGGPGIPEYLLEFLYPTHLQSEFVVCYLDYRGMALSYDSKTDSNTITTECYLSDIVEVTKYLCKRFNTEKMYLCGHSFGSYMGIKMAYEHPEFYYGYIAVSQMSDQYQSEILAYDYMVDQYQKMNNHKKLKQFAKYQIKDSKEDFNLYFTSMLRDSSMHELGIGTTRHMKSVAKDIVIASFRCPAYSFMETINIWRGKILSNQSIIVKEAWNYDAFHEIKELKIPIYFFGGIHDYTCCYSLQKKYFEQLQSTEKYFYTFEESAHSPLFEEPEKALSILKTILHKNI